MRRPLRRDLEISRAQGDGERDSTIVVEVHTTLMVSACKKRFVAVNFQDPNLGCPRRA